MSYDSIHRGFTTSASYTTFPTTPKFTTWISYDDYVYEQRWLRERQEYIYSAMGIDPINMNNFKINKLKLKVI